MPTFDIEINGQPFGSIEKNLPFLNRSITSTTTVGAVRAILCLGTTAFTRLAVWLRRFQKAVPLGRYLCYRLCRPEKRNFGAYARNCNRRRKLYAE